MMMRYAIVKRTLMVLTNIVRIVLEKNTKGEQLQNNTGDKNEREQSKH